MLISTSTNVMGEIGSVATSTFAEISPVFFLIIGTIFAFFIASMIVDLVQQRRFDARIDDTLKRSRENIDL